TLLKRDFFGSKVSYLKSTDDGTVSAPRTNRHFAQKVKRNDTSSLSISSGVLPRRCASPDLVRYSLLGTLFAVRRVHNLCSYVRKSRRYGEGFVLNLYKNFFSKLCEPVHSGWRLRGTE